MRRPRRALLLAAALLGTTASSQASAAEPVLLDRVAAVVNDDIVLVSELDRAVQLDPLVAQQLAAMATATPAQLAAKRTELRARVLDDLIEHKLVLSEARKLQITASDADLDSYMQNLAERNGMSGVEELRQAVEGTSEFGTWTEYRARLREDIVVYKVQNVLAAPVVTDAQVRERYRKMSKGEEAKVEVVRLSFRPASAKPADRDKAQATAKKYARRLSAGEESKALATELGQSDEPRLVTRRQVAPEIGDVLFSAKEGAVVGPIDSGQGFVVYKIVSVKASDLVGFEKARDGLRMQLEAEAQEKAGKDLREKLRARSHVDIRL